MRSPRTRWMSQWRRRTTRGQQTAHSASFRVCVTLLNAFERLVLPTA